LGFGFGFGFLFLFLFLFVGRHDILFLLLLEPLLVAVFAIAGTVAARFQLATSLSALEPWTISSAKLCRLQVSHHPCRDVASNVESAGAGFNRGEIQNKRH
jgi:hypothetical protein